MHRRQPMAFRDLDLVPLRCTTRVITTWRTAAIWLLTLFFINGIVVSILAVLGRDWRNPVPTLAMGVVPALAMGLVFGELSACIVNIVWGFGNFGARVLLLLSAILIAAPVGAFAISPEVAANGIREWIE